ncbi:hypothetical protein [Paenarthrobacter sp. 22069]|uniref:hypothetical protein n=1 Tax=Paenarthrobacter sp. 22069 TaxID=3453864 RepID=UPI003F86EE04
MKNTAVAEPSHPALMDQKAFSPARRKGLTAAGYLFAVAGVAFLAWFRLPEVSRGTLWAEDAAVFLANTMSIGPWQSIAEPYAGYLHTVPRIVSGIAYSLGPLEAYGTLMSFLSCLVVAAISVGSYFLSGQLFGHRSYRLMVALIPVLVPVAPLEVLGNAANLHWYMLWICPLLLIYRPRTWYGGAALFVGTLAAATTEIITGLFLPLAVWSLVRKKNYWAPAALILGLGFQLVATISKPRYTQAPRMDSVEPLSILYGFLLQPIGSLWETNPRTMGLNVVTFGGFAIAVPCAIFVGLLVYVLFFGRWRWKTVAMGAVGSAVACWVAATVLNPSPEFDYANFTKDQWLTMFTFFRYAVAPSMFLLMLVPLACVVAEDRKLIAGSGHRYWAPALLAVFLSTTYFQAATARQTGPEWAVGVQNATVLCGSDSALPEAVIPVTPAAWQVAVRCDLLRGR